MAERLEDSRKRKLLINSRMVLVSRAFAVPYPSLTTGQVVNKLRLSLAVPEPKRFFIELNSISLMKIVDLRIGSDVDYKN